MTESHSSAPLKDRITKHWPWIALLAASAMALAAVFVVPYVPGHDGPHHIFLAHLENHYRDPQAPYPHFYTPGMPITALGFLLPYAPLEELLGWLPAFRIYLALLVSLWGWGCVLLFRAISPQRIILGLVAFALSFQWALYMGFYSFMMGTAIGMFVLALGLGRYPWSLRRKLAISALLFVEALAHVFTAEATALVLIVAVLVRAPNGRRLRELTHLGLMGIPTLGLAVLSSLWAPAMNIPLLAGDADVIPISFSEKLLLAAHGFAGGPWWRAWLPVLMAGTGLASGIYLLVSKHITKKETVPLLGGMALFLLFAITPLNLKSWQFVSPRFLPLGFVLLLGTIPLEKLPKKWFTVSVAIMAVYVVGAIGWSTSFHRRLWNQIRTAIEGTSQPFEPNRVLLPVVIDKTAAGRGTWKKGEYWFYEPMGALGDLYATTQNRVVPYTFTIVPQLHGFVFRKNPTELFPPYPNYKRLLPAYQKAIRANDRKEMLRLVTLLAIFGSGFDGVVLQEMSIEHQVFLDRGFDVKWHRGKTWLLKYRGCPTRLEVRGVADQARTAVQVRYAWHPQTMWMKASPSIASGTGTAAVSMNRAPCGLVRIQVHGIPRSAPNRVVSCAGADESGTFLVKLNPRVHRIVCTLRAEDNGEGRQRRQVPGSEP